MKWLIVEDALRDKWGHWVEYLRTFRRGLEECGDKVVILCDRHAEPGIVEEFGAAPVLPQSIWHRMSDGAGGGRRYARVPGHGLATFFALRKIFSFQFSVFSKHGETKGGSGGVSHGGTAGAEVSDGSAPDVIFVPTVLVHHLLGWWLLLKAGLVPAGATVLLFFPNLPLRVDECGNVRWNRGPTTRLMARLLRSLRPEIEARRVILGVETRAMRSALAQTAGLPVVYLPHPVSGGLKREVAGGGLRVTGEAEQSAASSGALVFACYGGARAEKGSDIFQEAIRIILKDKEPGKERMRFALQWIEDFDADDGRVVRLARELEESDRVEVIRRYFEEGEYGGQLARTDVMVLPYQSRSYRLRVSRVVIEAMVHGMPVVVTEGTTMSGQVGEFGAGLAYAGGDARSLAEAMGRMAAQFDDYHAAAQARAGEARDHFSVENFRRRLLNYLSAGRLVLGDSHVAGWNADWEGAWTYGISGATSAQLLEHAAGWSVREPEQLILWIGANDVLQGVSEESTAENMRELLKKFPKARGCGKAVIVSVPPLVRGFADASARNAKIVRLNGLLAQAAVKAGVRFINCTASLAGDGGFLDDSLSVDGEHLNRGGYAKVEALVEAVIGR